MWRARRNPAVGVFDATGAHLQTADSTKAVDWFGTVRGRVGFTLPSIPNLMIYGTGGFAYGQVIHNVGFADNFAGAAAAGFAGGAVGHGYSDDTRTGWTAGGGVEWSPIPNWSVKAEYLYVDLGSTNANSVSLNGGTAAILGATTPVFAATQSSPTRFHNVRVGLNWHFDPFAPGLVSRSDGLSSLKEPPPPAFVDSYQPFQVRLKVGSVIPLDGHGTVYDQGIGHPALGSIGRLSGLTGANGVIAGASTNTSTSIVPMLDVAYYLTKNWAIEAICCVAPHHIQGTGTIASDFARAWVFPPSLMAQYHFTNFGQFQPYLGVGANFTAFWGTRVNNDCLGHSLRGGLGAGRSRPARSARHLPMGDGRPLLGRGRPSRLRLYVQRALGRERRRQIYRHSSDGSRHGRRFRAGGGGSRSDLRPGQSVAADQSDRRLGGRHLSLRRRPVAARARQILSERRKSRQIKPAPKGAGFFVGSEVRFAPCSLPPPR